jgi:hypothetical protein
MTRAVLFTLIGDLVGSRRVESTQRRLLQERLRTALERINEEMAPRAPLEPTVGDEFQGCFDDLSAAVRASLILRLELLRTAGVDSRYGLGAGAIEIFERRTPLSQDGAGWWAAREAIESAHRLGGESHTAFVRTYFADLRSDLRNHGGESGALNAFLLCRDAMVDQMKPSNRSRLYGLMQGWPQSQIAEEEGTTQGAISQSLARSGAFAILTAEQRLEEELR